MDFRLLLTTGSRLILFRDQITTRIFDKFELLLGINETRRSCFIKKTNSNNLAKNTTGLTRCNVTGLFDACKINKPEVLEAAEGVDSHRLPKQGGSSE